MQKMLIDTSHHYTNNRKCGEVVDDIDLLIGSVALSNNMGVVTDNQKHFRKIKGLYLEDWTVT